MPDVVRTVLVKIWLHCLWGVRTESGLMVIQRFQTVWLLLWIFVFTLAIFGINMNVVYTHSRLYIWFSRYWYIFSWFCRSGKDGVDTPQKMRLLDEFSQIFTIFTFVYCLAQWLSVKVKIHVNVWQKACKSWTWLKGESPEVLLLVTPGLGSWRTPYYRFGG